MILGMLGLGAAMDITGAAETLAKAFASVAGGWHPR